jgi:hypothetical protein
LSPFASRHVPRYQLGGAAVALRDRDKRCIVFPIGNAEPGMSDDSLYREVDEAIRQDQLKKLWDKYGLAAVSGAILIVAAVGGYKAWVYWQSEQAKTAGARFVGGLTEIQDGKQAEAAEVFTSLAEDGPSGYKTLARFQLAALYVEQGKQEDALTIYEELASDSSLGQVQKNFATIQAAYLKLDKTSFEDMRAQLDPIAVTGNQWRHSARELLGLSAYRTGEASAAERYFNVILSDQQTPASMRQRAEMMLALMIQSDSGKPAAGN